MSFLTPAPPANVHIIRIVNPNSQGGVDVGNFGTRLATALGNYGIHIIQPILVQNAALPAPAPNAPQLRRRNFGRNLRSAYQRLSSLDDQWAHLIVVLLLDTNTDAYSDIKWWAECELGIPTLCVAPKAVEKVITGHGDQTLLGNLSYVAMIKQQSV